MKFRSSNRLSVQCHQITRNVTHRSTRNSQTWLLAPFQFALILSRFCIACTMPFGLTHLQSIARCRSHDTIPICSPYAFSIFGFFWYCMFFFESAAVRHQCITSRAHSCLKNGCRLVCVCVCPVSVRLSQMKSRSRNQIENPQLVYPVGSDGWRQWIRPRQAVNIDGSNCSGIDRHCTVAYSAALL